MATRKELIGAVGARYRGAPRDEKHKILDEFVALTGSHRKHAIRILSREPTGERLAVTRDRIYDEAVRHSLIMLWEAADRICGKRLKVMIPILIDAMERYGHLDLDQNVNDKVLFPDALGKSVSALVTLFLDDQFS